VYKVPEDVSAVKVLEIQGCACFIRGRGNILTAETSSGTLYTV
jgi:hypothetical protein